MRMIGSEFDPGTEPRGNVTHRALQVHAQRVGCAWHVTITKTILDVSPDVGEVPSVRTVFDRPPSELANGRLVDEAFREHVVQPHAIMGRKDELSVWELLLQQAA